MKIQILNTILDAHQAREIASDYKLSSEQEGAEQYFNAIYAESEWEMEEMPKYNKFIQSIEGGDLYYDYGADYYFLVQKQNVTETKNVKNKSLIRLTESDLHTIIKETVNKVLKEGKLGSAYENLEHASELLKDIMNSSFIPFSSPNPSSTEEELKMSIVEAARMIDKAMYLCGKLGYNNPIAHIA